MAEPLLSSELMTRLEQLQVISRRMATGRMRGERRSRRRGHSTDFADYRNYVAGDDIRHLDWKIYARLERLYLKLFLEEEDLQVFIMIDTSPSMDFGEPNKLHYAKQVAAALGYISLCKMDSVTVQCFSEGLLEKWGPKRGKATGGAYFDFLQNVKIGTQTSLFESMRLFSQTGRGKGIVVVLSDFYDFSGYEDGLRFLFGRDFEVFAIHLLSPEEMKPDLKGDIRLVDMEFEYTTDISVGKQLLKLYDKTLNTFCNGLKSFIMNRGGFYMLTSTELPFDRLVLDVLCRRGLLR